MLGIDEDLAITMSNHKFETMVQDIHKYLETRSLDQQFGKIAIKKGFLSDRDIQVALSMQLKSFKKNKSCRLIGDILVEANLLNENQRDSILEDQKRSESMIPSGPDKDGKVEIPGIKGWYSRQREEIASEGIVNFLLRFVQKRAIPVIISILVMTIAFIFYASLTKPQNYRQIDDESLISKIFHFGKKKYVYPFSFSTSLADNSYLSLEMDVIFFDREGYLEIIRKEDMIQHAFTIVFNPRVASQIKTRKKMIYTLKKIFNSQLDNRIADVEITKYVLTKHE